MIWWYCLSSRVIRFNPTGVLLLASPFIAIIRENVLFSGDREISVLFAIGYELLSPGSWWGRGRFSGETSEKKIITYTLLIKCLTLVISGQIQVNCLILVLDDRRVIVREVLENGHRGLPL